MQGNLTTSSHASQTVCIMHKLHNLIPHAQTDAWTILISIKPGEIKVGHGAFDLHIFVRSHSTYFSYASDARISNFHESKPTFGANKLHSFITLQSDCLQDARIEVRAVFNCHETRQHQHPLLVHASFTSSRKGF